MMFSTHLAHRQPRSAVKPVALAVATALVALSSAHAQTASKAADSKADAAAPATVIKPNGAAASTSATFTSADQPSIRTCARRCPPATSR